MAIDVPSKLGKRLKELRNEKGLSQERLGLDCGLDRTYINSIENGKRNITIVSLNKIIKVLNINLYDFFNSPIFKEGGNK